MESLILIVDKIQRACTALGDHGEGSSLLALGDSLLAIAVVGAQIDELACFASGMLALGASGYNDPAE